MIQSYLNDDASYSRYYIIEYYDDNGKTNWFDTYASSEAEAVGKFLMWNENLCYSNVIDILVDNNF